MKNKIKKVFKETHHDDDMKFDDNAYYSNPLKLPSKYQTSLIKKGEYDKESILTKNKLHRDQKDILQGACHKHQQACLDHNQYEKPLNELVEEIR